MLRRTHIAIGLAIGLYFLPFINHKLLFIPIILIASVLPDIDSISSHIGKRKIFRPLQAIFVHRGPLHSYTFCVGFSFVFAFIYPVVALPFFLGYSFHLFADSFTRRGLRPFWPLKFVSSGVVRTGRIVDRTIFYTMVIIDLFLFILLFL
jgi:membrane-bound metal-dependent hydrolase YbcI (DUF457 family)